MSQTMLSVTPQKIKKNARFLWALDVMNGEAPFVFLTGRAGTGKSTLLQEFRHTTSKKCVYLAPTGVAALNIGGETIHSFFGFPPNIVFAEARRRGKAASQRQVFEKLDAIVIDEISMVRADLLDCVDGFLRGVLGNDMPFGGKQIIAIGDLYQLPPVVTTFEKEAFAQLYRTPYFFASHAFDVLAHERLVEYVELDEVHRQKDEHFIHVLNAVRSQEVTDGDLSILNERHHNLRDDDAIILTTTNAGATTLNTARLHALRAKPLTYRAVVKGKFEEKDMPTDKALVLKVGARVMCLVNAADGSYVNGSLGTVKGCDKDWVRVKLDDTGATVTIAPYAWTMYKSTYNAHERALDQEKTGSFTQIPLRLAWAVTIHKSQGKTFDKVIIDFGHGAFAHGQAYVALSRCRTLGGITLCQPLRRRDVLVDEAVVRFMQKVESSE